MASETDLPHCTQCLQSFKYRGPDPYLLPCLHSVCENCLYSDHEDVVSCKVCQECFTRTGNNFPAYCHSCLSNPDPCFSCAKCQNIKRETEISFQKDHVTIRKVFIITAKENASELLCTNRNDGNQAQSWCQECEAFLCEHCQVSHEDMKATRNHDVTSVQDLAETESNPQTPGHCSIHKGHPLEHYDQDCNILICYKCSQNEHKCCKECDLEAEMHGIIEDTARSIGVLTVKIDEIDQLQQRVQEIDQGLDERKMALTDAVEHSFSDMKTVLGQREEEVKLQLDQCLQYVKRQNIEILKTLKTEKERHEVALHINKGLLGVTAPSDLFSLRRFIGNRTSNLASTELPLVRMEASSIKFLAPDLREIKRAISSHGTFGTLSGRVEDDTTPEAAEATKNITITYSSNVTSAVFTGAREAFIVKFLEVEFDVHRANTGKVEFTSDMKLSRKLLTTQPPEGSKRLVCLSGTTSFQPVSASDIQYWEVNADVEILKVFEGAKLLFEVGIGVDSSIDVNFKLSGQPDSMVLYPMYCTAHHGLCLRIRRNTNDGSCLHKPLATGIGERKVLEYGIMTNPKERKCTLFDLNRTAILHTFQDVNFSQTFWPTFAVLNRYNSKTELQCISGGQIQLNRVKLDLLQSCFERETIHHEPHLSSTVLGTE